jgi:hypothetical protein
MSNKLTKREAERLIAALDELDADRLPRLRAAAASALSRLLAVEAPWAELVDAAASVTGWSRDRVRRLTDDATGDTDDALEAMYELITELSETRRL